MPTYVYKFIDTGETIEVQQSFADDALTEAVHPATGATLPVKKVFLPVGVTFKGGGFYKTDSRGGSKSTTPSNGAAGAKEATTATPTSGESSGAATGGSNGSATPAPASTSPPATTSSNTGNSD